MVQESKSKAVFLDRGGVINALMFMKSGPRSHRDSRQFQILPGVEESLLELKKSGFLTIVITNQPEIKRGFLTAEKLELFHES